MSTAGEKGHNPKTSKKNRGRHCSSRDGAKSPIVRAVLGSGLHQPCFEAAGASVDAFKLGAAFAADDAATFDAYAQAGSVRVVVAPAGEIHLGF